MKASALSTGTYLLAEGIFKLGTGNVSCNTFFV